MTQTNRGNISQVQSLLPGYPLLPLLSRPGHNLLDLKKIIPSWKLQWLVCIAASWLTDQVGDQLSANIFNNILPKTTFYTSPITLLFQVNFPRQGVDDCSPLSMSGRWLSVAQRRSLWRQNKTQWSSWTLCLNSFVWTLCSWTPFWASGWLGQQQCWQSTLAARPSSPSSSLRWSFTSHISSSFTY